MKFTSSVNLIMLTARVFKWISIVKLELLGFFVHDDDNTVLRDQCITCTAEVAKPCTGKFHKQVIAENF